MIWEFFAYFSGLIWQVLLGEAWFVGWAEETHIAIASIEFRKQCLQDEWSLTARPRYE